MLSFYSSLAKASMMVTVAAADVVFDFFRILAFFRNLFFKNIKVINYHTFIYYMRSLPFLTSHWMVCVLNKIKTKLSSVNEIIHKQCSVYVIWWKVKFWIICCEVTYFASWLTFFTSLYAFFKHFEANFH